MYKFIIISLKNNIIPIIFLIFTICLVIFSNNNILATKEGLLLWANNIVPSLLPFFIATELLSYTDIIRKIGRILEPIMRPLFNIPGIGSFALIMGIISGYPTGAKIVSNLKENNLCSNEEAERMIAFTNNSGPLFILGTVGISMFGNSTIGLLLLATHILSCITVGFIFRFWKTKTSIEYKHENYKINDNSEKISFSNLGEILSKSILSSIKTILIIGGFVVLFSVILSILKNSKILYIFSYSIFPIFNLFNINDINFAIGFSSGIFEVTNGLTQLTSINYKNISINIILSSFLLGFGGFSVLLQVYSIISKSDISIKPYFIGKLLHGTLAALYTFIAIYLFPIFNFNL